MLTVADFYGLVVYIILYIAKLVNLFLLWGKRKSAAGNPAAQELFLFKCPDESDKANQ